MKNRYFTAHQNEHGHREWIETDKLIPEMAPKINTSLTIGTLFSSDFHYWDGELFIAIDPHHLTFHGEDRYQTSMERAAISDHDWETAPIGCLVFSHSHRDGVELIHIFFLRISLPMEQIECDWNTLKNEQQMAGEIDPETKAECDKVIDWVEVDPTKDLGFLYFKKPPLFSKITRKYRWTTALRKWLLSLTKAGRMFLAFESISDLTKFNWEQEFQKEYIRVHSQKLIK